MAIFTMSFVSCNAKTTLPTDTTNQTTRKTTVTTNVGTISESTLYVVEFDSGEAGSVPDTGIFKGEKITEPNVIKTGYSLDGWYLSNDNGVTLLEKWNFNEDTVTGNIKLDAVWNIKQYTITFITNGGLGLDPLTLDYGSEIILEDPIRFDYEFGGWYLDGELTNPFTSTTMPAFDLALYAKWNEAVNAFEVHYYLLPVGFNPLPDEIVTETPKFISFSVTSYFTVALTDNHKVYTWGYNEYYQLGTGDIANKTLPTNITSNFNLDESDYIIQVETGYMHSIALTNNGKVYTWGDNSVGQLGTDEYSDTTLPIDITFFFNLNLNEVIISTALGGNHSLALTSEGRVFSLGLNFSMQLGDGTNTTRTAPLEPGTYTIEVSGYDETETGPYELYIIKN